MPTRGLRREGKFPKETHPSADAECRPRCGGCGTSLTGRRGRQFCRRAPRPEIPGGEGPSTGARGEWGNPCLAFPPFSLSFPSVFSSCLFGIKVNLSFSFVAQHLLPPSVFGDLPDLWSPANTCLRAGRGLLSGRPLGAGEVPWLRTHFKWMDKNSLMNGFQLGCRRLWKIFSPVTLVISCCITKYSQP